MNFQTCETTGHGRYAKLAKAVASILAATIHPHPALRLQHVQRRPKDSSSLAKKLAKAGALDSADIGAAVKDLAGCRLGLLYEL
jgi:ppGpp synthetase/RelA/SpoT-type nucleotidyltranferase